MSSTIAAYVSSHLPQSRMRRYPTKVINLIGGPGCGKSLYASAIVLKLLLRHKSTETVPDIGKTLVWQQDHEALRNQYGVALSQYRMLEVLDGEVSFIVTEGGLPQLLYYNAHYPENVCDIDKTRQQILAWYNQFNNINILVERDLNKPYVHRGRYQDETHAREIDFGLRRTLEAEGMPFITLPPDHRAIIEFAAKLE